MRTINKNIALLMVWLMATQPLLAAVPAGSMSLSGTPTSEISVTQGSVEEARGVELSGYYEDRTAELRAEMNKDHKPGMTEDGMPMPRSPIADLPVVDDKLAERAITARADEEIRVLIHLDYLPHGEVLRNTMRQFESEVDAVEEARVSLLNELEANRSRDTERDSEDYANMFTLADDQRAALKVLHEQNEAVALQIKDAVSSELRSLIDMSQKPVIQEIERLGGVFEFGTIANNTIVALVPPSAIEALGKTPGILRMVEDSVMEGHLNVADTSTMVDPADTSLFGLWDAGLDGGIYDPAIIDSGLDLSHPAMQNSTTPLRNNFGSWYLVAGFGSANWDDQISQDDMQGHGTHVAGIVGSYGSAGYTQNLGMAHGIDKLVNLKAGWRNTVGTASMFWSDKYNLVDRALYNTAALQGGDFNDDVDGMNLSYGGSTTLNDTDGGRFWDSVISTYNDLPVTISAGNSGPSNTLFNDPAVSYNAIAVANANDRGTTTRDDDIINAGSTVGPTASGRRKPDLAAPGTSISAPNHNWEAPFAADHVNKTGTSMAAPMVLGIIMDLADAGVFDELRVKALLINTAQKNLPGMNIESDSDGWDPQIGWGMVNAFAAYFHRFDTFADSVAPRNTAGDYQLYRGSMRDEGAAGEGRDRATMVWNRSATYETADTPSTYYTLSDLNLRLYQEDNNALLDIDSDGINNVHQVRIPAGRSDTDVVINAYAWSTAFNNGLAEQNFVLATEDGFTRVDRPTQFQGIAVWPSSVEPNEVFNVEFWLRNDSELASHQNQLEFLGNNGFTLISGPSLAYIGSIAGEGGNSIHTTYSVKAPPTAVGSVSFTVAHSHNSYNEPYGNFNWNMSTTVEVDVTPPSPNPMSFSVSPTAQSTSVISMTASFASDVHNPVEYYLDYTSSPSFGASGTDSGWQASRSYSDDFLQTNDQYCYRAWARDSANSPNNTTPSSIECAYTHQVVASPVVPTSVTTSAITVQPQGFLNNLTLDQSGLRIEDAVTGQSTGWVQSTAPYTIVGLAAASTHKFEASARNGDGIVSGYSDITVVYTLANPPAGSSLNALSDSTIRVNILANGNEEAEYQIQNTTNGDTSGWTNGLSWDSTGLDCQTNYNFQAKARNQDGIETIIVPLGSTSTLDCSVDTDGDGVEDGADNCTLISNADQRDTNGDGYGNACDPDLNNDGTVNFVDISLFGAVFPSSGVDLDEDFNGDNLVNFVDYVLFSSFFLDPPGPSGVAP